MVQLFNQLLFIHHQAFKDLKRSLQKKITIFITIFISVFILFVISTLNQSLLQEIRSNTKSILGGDVEIEVKNQELNETVLQSIETFADISLNTTIASMVANENLNPPKTSFVQLRAVDSLYPLYGEFITTKGKVERDFFENSNLAIINENLAANLQLKEGDTLIIRDQSFIVHSIIQQMPDLGGAGLFGDLVVISQLGLSSLSIPSSENFFEFEYRVKYFDSISEELGKQNLKDIFSSESEIRVRFPENTTNFIQRTLDNFANFLSLISLAAILIAGIGISNTVIAYINQNYNAIAVQKSLGLNTKIIQGILGYQIFFITLVICIMAFFLSSLVPSMVNTLLPSGLNFSLSSASNFFIFIKITSVALIAITIFLLPALNSIQQLSANSLFRNTYEFVSFHFSLKTVVFIVLLVLLLISIFTLGSSLWFYNIIFLVGFLFAISLFYFVFKLFNHFFGKIKFIQGLNLLLAKRNITSPSSIGPLILTTLGIGISLLLTILTIAGSFQNLIQKSVDTKAPDFFFIGIDQSLKQDFQDYVMNADPLSDLVVVPIATAKIQFINDVDPRTYIDRQNPSYWVIQEERRISWVDEPASNNPIVEGQWWEDNPLDQMYVSFDHDAAQDLGIKINDQITLSVYGREVTGIVKNFRDVDYADFTINFAMLLNTNYAQAIPHEYLATVKLSKQNNFQEYELLKQFPNISSIKIASYAQKINQLLNQVNIAVLALAAIIIFIGLLVISSAILVQGKNKIYQNLVFKILGLNKIQIIKTSLLEFIILFSNTILLTLLISFTASYLVVHYIFNIEWHLDLFNIFLVYLLTGVFTMALIIFDTYKNLSPKVYPIIRNN
jgi:putative ABC transport system permease protein